MLRIAVGAINAEEALQRAVIQGHVGQAAHIDDIVDVRMGGVQTHEAIDSRLSQRKIGVFIIRINQIQLYLLGIRAEWITIIQRFQLRYRLFPVTVLQFLLGGRVDFIRRIIRHLFLRAGATHQSQAQCGGCHQVFHARHDVLTSSKCLCGRISVPAPD